MTDIDLQNKFNEFKRHWQQDPNEFHEGQSYIIKLYKTQKNDGVFQGGIYTTEESIVQRTDFRAIIFEQIEELPIEKYIKFDKFSLSPELLDFLKLQNINKSYISLTDNIPTGYDISQIYQLNTKLFDYYLTNLKKAKDIRAKALKIVRDKFNVLPQAEDVNTSAIFSNLGYIVKGLEGKYLALSKYDKRFIKDFMQEQIKDGAYKLTIQEALPLYKESLQEIIAIGKELLRLVENKRKIKSFSQKYLGTERKTLESCWQLYFEKYLQILLMSYKNFYPQVVFKPMPGYDQTSRPDFLAVDIYNNVDIIEIKHHRQNLLRKEVGRDSYYPSHELNKAVFQLNKYIDLRPNDIELSRIQDEYVRSLIENDKIYRPRGILIISSRDHIASEATNEETWVRLEKEIKKLKTTYTNIDIVLFDELIQNLENYVQHIEVALNTNYNAEQ